MQAFPGEHDVDETRVKACAARDEPPFIRPFSASTAWPISVDEQILAELQKLNKTMLALLAHVTNL